EPNAKVNWFVGHELSFVSKNKLDYAVVWRLALSADDVWWWHMITPFFLILFHHVGARKPRSRKRLKRTHALYYHTGVYCLFDLSRRIRIVPVFVNQFFLRPSINDAAKERHDDGYECVLHLMSSNV